jgi:hypothetical protein
MMRLFNTKKKQMMNCGSWIPLKRDTIDSKFLYAYRKEDGLVYRIIDTIDEFKLIEGLSVDEYLKWFDDETKEELKKLIDD